MRGGVSWNRICERGAARRLQFVTRVQESRAGAGWIPRVVRCIAVAVVVAVVGLLCKIQSTILRNLGVADIAFRELNDVRCLVE